MGRPYEQPQFEAIVEWLGWKIDDSLKSDDGLPLWIRDDDNNVSFTYSYMFDWIGCNHGTVAMIKELKHRGKFKTMTEALLEDDINRSLQTACLNELEC